MANEDRKPLLCVDEDADEDNNRIARRRGYQSSNAGSLSDSGQGETGRVTLTTSPSLAALAESDFVAAIFVVAFDTRSGNMVEWCLPEDIDLDGVEFKAMPSGSHTLDRDFVYFRKEGLYGLSCFENMPVESEIERGARMKSVGILSYSYTNLYRHMQFLETQVRHQLETPGKYTQLTALYNDKKAELGESSPTGILRPSPLSTPSTPSQELLPEMKITHPAGCFAQFINFFGDHVFTLWKFALLQRRIIFFSPPPIGVVCYRVYCACCLASHNVQGLGNHELRPHFYINVADIETLENEVSYIACTTEKIFESKSHLYDIYVDNQNINCSSPAMKDLLKTCDADREKLTKLNNQRAQHTFPLMSEEVGEDDITEEEVILSYFMELNDRLFHTLLDISMSHDRQLTSDHMKAIGLDPVGDRTFLMELVEHYGIDVVLMVDNPCCPK
ncbi:DENN domain-containing protein 11-like [Littorina saxatilis]|uniref:DENN domain-containing protein 11 n=1 Tax=Littorina saxatilis TaxID=31220 RepID=A0AAN9C0P3_9CAEN